MSDNVTKEPVVQANTEAKKEAVEKAEATSNNGGGIKFFRNCSASLKRFSILIFLINIFLAITGVTVGTVVLFVYLQLNIALLGVLAIPVLTALIIFIVLARFISALIYGYAEIVEKAEK